MSETADVANTLPAIILLSFWWALLSALELLSRSRESGTTGASDTMPPEIPRATADEQFPELRELDPEFSAEKFLHGARRAYEAILESYARCDIEALRPLLAGDVLQTFAEACESRSLSGEALELTFIGFESAEIIGVETSQEAIAIQVLFRSQLVSSERSATGEVIRGDPHAVVRTDDLWTFARSIRSNASAWVVAATDDGSG